MRTKIIRIAAIALVAILALLAWQQFKPVPKPPSDIAAELPEDFLEGSRPDQLAQLGLKTPDPAMEAVAVAVTADPVAPEAAEPLKVIITGTGVGALALEVTNPAAINQRYKIAPGDLFVGNGVSAVALKPVTLELRPGESTTSEVEVACAVLNTLNTPGEFVRQDHHLTALDRLFAASAIRPQTSEAVLQTAILLVTENVSLHVLAKFPTLDNDMPERFDTEIFKVPVGDIMGALTLLNDAGYPRSQFAVASSFQLQAQAMIAPEVREEAMLYFGIARADEWAWWKKLLLRGDPSFRHYALYGIARNYPAVAVEMLPQWALERRTKRIFRLSAIRALAATARPDAAVRLNEMLPRFANDPEMERSAKNAIRYLNSLQGIPTPADELRPASNETPFAG